jgi:hypothetical protein
MLNLLLLLLKNRALRRQFAAKRDGYNSRRKQCNEELHNLRTSQEFIKIIQLRRMNWHSHFSTSGTQWRSWLRHYAASRKFAGSIPDEIIGFFS